MESIKATSECWFYQWKYSQIFYSDGVREPCISAGARVTKSATLLFSSSLQREPAPKTDPALLATCVIGIFIVLTGRVGWITALFSLLSSEPSIISLCWHFVPTRAIWCWDRNKRGKILSWCLLWLPFPVSHCPTSVCSRLRKQSKNTSLMKEDTVLSISQAVRRKRIGPPKVN